MIQPAAGSAWATPRAASNQSTTLPPAPPSSRGTRMWRRPSATMRSWQPTRSPVRSAGAALSRTACSRAASSDCGTRGGARRGPDVGTVRSGRGVGEEGGGHDGFSVAWVQWRMSERSQRVPRGRSGIRAVHGFVSVETTDLAHFRVVSPEAVGVLTAREAEVLALVQRRLTNAEIAEQLFVSVRTVETHVSSVLRKLGAGDRRALASIVAARDRPRRTSAGRTRPGRTVGSRPFAPSWSAGPTWSRRSRRSSGKPGSPR